MHTHIHTHAHTHTNTHRHTHHPLEECAGSQVSVSAACIRLYHANYAIGAQVQLIRVSVYKTVTHCMVSALTTHTYTHTSIQTYTQTHKQKLHIHAPKHIHTPKPGTCK